MFFNKRCICWQESFVFVYFSPTLFRHHLLHLSVSDLFCWNPFRHVSALLRYVHLNSYGASNQENIWVCTSHLSIWIFHYENFTYRFICVYLNNYVRALTNNIALICFIFWLMFVILRSNNHKPIKCINVMLSFKPSLHILVLH